MSWSLLGALVALALWVLGTFIFPVGLGLVHILLAIGVVLLVRWWALRERTRGGRAGP